MKKIIHSFTVIVLIGLILVSCSSATPTAAPLPIQATATQNLTDKVSIELTVQYDTAAQYNTVNQIIRFKYIIKMVKNDITDATPANITISGITAVCPAINTVGNLNDRLDPGEIIECTGDYILTQADLDRGSVSNVATANVYTVNSNPVTTTVTTTPAKALTLTVTAEPTSYYQSGQTIKYTYTLKNSGSTPLGPTPPFTVTNNNVPINCGNADATIAPGATLTCSSTYTITAADMSLASITSNATASGGGANPSPSVAVTLTKTSAPALAKGATIQHVVKEGEWLWQISRCYGADPAKTVEANKQLANPAEIKKDVVVTVPNIGSNGTIYGPQDCVKLYIVQASDTWSTIASLNEADPGFTQYVNGNTLTVGKQVKIPRYTKGMNFQIPTVSTTTPAPSTSALTLSVTANPTTYSQSGQIITFNYVIKNNGTTTLGPSAFTVTDSIMNGVPLTCGAATTTIAPGASINCNYNLSITDQILSLATLSTSATATGGGITTSPATSVTISKSTTLLTLTITTSSMTYNQVGQIITYTYVIKNSGTTTLGPAQFTITDTLFGNTPINCGANNTTLAPNATVSCIGELTITDQLLTLSTIANSATAAGGGAPTSQPANITITKQ